MKRILSVAAAIAIGTAAFVPAQAYAQVGFNIVIGNAPPPVQYEVVPAPRRGYEWAPGYWNWNGRQHQWSQGHWERARPGRMWNPVAGTSRRVAGNTWSVMTTAATVAARAIAIVIASPIATTAVPIIHTAIES
jgi:hypothetical protein